MSIITENNQEFPKARRSHLSSRPLHDDALACAAIRFRKIHNRLPQPKDQYDCLLPERPSWLTHLRLLQKRGTTLSLLVKEYEQRNSLPAHTKRNRKGPAPLTTLDDGALAVAATKLRESRKRLPQPDDKYDFLPSGSPSWMTHLRRLQQRGTTIRRLLNEYEGVTDTPNTAPEQKEVKKRQKPLDTSEILHIGFKALCIKTKIGHLPSNTTSFENVSWAAIRVRLAKQKTTLSIAIRDYLREASNRNPVPDATAVFESSAKITRQEKRVPAHSERIAEWKIVELDKLFEEQAILGWQDYMPGTKRPPSNLNEFMVAARLVRVDFFRSGAHGPVLRPINLDI